jgi:hypothetical protein
LMRMIPMCPSLETRTTGSLAAVLVGSGVVIVLPKVQ